MVGSLEPILRILVWDQLDVKFRIFSSTRTVVKAGPLRPPLIFHFPFSPSRKLEEAINMALQSKRMRLDYSVGWQIVNDSAARERDESDFMQCNIILHVRRGTAKA